MTQIRNTVVSVILLVIFSLFNSCTQRPAKFNSNDAMFMNNMEHTSKYKSTSLKKDPALLWKVKTEGQVISSPVVVDERVYIGSGDNKLYAINASSGNIDWTFSTSGPIYSTPGVSQGKVMFLSYDGFFYAVNQLDGSLAWKFKTGGEKKHLVKDYYNGEIKPDFWDFYLSSAVVKDDLVYFGSSDSNVYALDILSGENIWSYKTGGNIHSSPAIYDNALIVGSWDSRIYCLDAINGEENWIFETGRDTAQYIWLGIQASPSVDNGIAYIGSRDAKLYAMDIATGDTVWVQSEFDLSWVPSSVAIAKENIYSGSSDSFSFFSFNKSTGSVNYTAKTNAWTFSSPAIDDEMAYIGSANGRLFGINLESGEIKWEFLTIGAQTDTIKMFDNKGIMDVNRAKELNAGIRDMPTLTELNTKVFINVGSILSSPVISNQIIYFGSCDGYVYAVSSRIP